MTESQFEKLFSQNLCVLGAQQSDVKKWVVGYSGGVDSRILLDLLIKHNINKKEIVVVYVNHGLSEHELFWELSAIEVCKQYGVNLLIKRVDIEGDSSIEEKAREARYKAFMDEVTKDSVVFMGHHLNDNAETFLFRLFRGTGITGLQCIPEKRTFGSGFIVRPMMCFNRNQIEDYAKKQGFSWITDDSNIDVKFSRNYIRHNVIPIITKKWPSFLSVLNRTINHMRETTELLNEIAEQDYNLVYEQHKKHRNCKCISIEKLRLLSIPRIKNVLLRFCGDIEDVTRSSGWLDNLQKMIFAENKNNSKLRVIKCEKASIYSNGIHVWIKNND